MCSLGVFSYDDASAFRLIGVVPVLEALRYVEDHRDEVERPENFGLAVHDFSFAWDDDSDAFVGYDDSIPAREDGSADESWVGTESWLSLEGDDVRITGPWLVGPHD